MRIFKYIILMLFLWNVPSYLLAYYGPTLGSLSSYAASLLLLFYYFLVRDKHRILLPFIILGISYFMLSSLNFSGQNAMDLIKEFIRFMIVVVCAAEVLYRTTKKELFIIFLIGALSIIVNAVVFPTANANFYPTYGRYSGFYLNPNFAGSICLVGYALCLTLTKKWTRILGQVIFTFGGILTFSRAFIVIWIILNLVSVIQNKKNLAAPLIGVVVFIGFFAISSGLTLNMERFTALESIFTEEAVKTNTIVEDTRSDTWALYTDMILTKPILGHGYMKFQTKHSGLPGVHNSYLMVLGEAGIVPFLLMIAIYAYMLMKSSLFFKTNPEYFFISCVASITLLTGHGYFSNYYNLFISMYVFIQFRKQMEAREDQLDKKPLSEIFL